MADGRDLTYLRPHKAVDVSDNGNHDGEDEEVFGQVVEPVHSKEGEDLLDGRRVPELALRYGDKRTVK